jgi:hypothetical protein
MQKLAPSRNKTRISEKIAFLIVATVLQVIAYVAVCAAYLKIPSTMVIVTGAALGFSALILSCVMVIEKRVGKPILKLAFFYILLPAWAVILAFLFFAVAKHHLSAV